MAISLGELFVLATICADSSGTGHAPFLTSPGIADPILAGSAVLAWPIVRERSTASSSHGSPWRDYLDRHLVAQVGRAAMEASSIEIAEPVRRAGPKLCACVHLPTSGANADRLYSGRVTACQQRKTAERHSPTTRWYWRSRLRGNSFASGIVARQRNAYRSGRRCWSGGVAQHEAATRLGNDRQGYGALSRKRNVTRRTGALSILAVALRPAIAQWPFGGAVGGGNGRLGA